MIQEILDGCGFVEQDTSTTVEFYPRVVVISFPLTDTSDDFERIQACVYGNGFPPAVPWHPDVEAVALAKVRAPRSGWSSFESPKLEARPPLRTRSLNHATRRRVR